MTSRFRWSRVLLASLLTASVSACGFLPERPADVEHRQVLERAGFRLEYPRNWSLDVRDEEYDPDHRFSIESAGYCEVEFQFFDERIDPYLLVEEEILVFRSIFNYCSTHEFQGWGKYMGAGIEMRGLDLFDDKQTVRIFAHASRDRSFVVSIDYNHEFLEAANPGFDMIESTFELLR